MGEGIGSYLQKLRVGQGLTIAQLAQKAGIRRATLSEWQSGKHQPRLPELDAVLTALGASETQKRQARERLHTPANLRRLHEETVAKNRDLVELAGTMPHGGDLLRAMRLRKGWTQEMVAAKMGVSRVTVVRWERAERWLDTRSLHTLCFLLGACEEELTALTVGRFSLGVKRSTLTEEDIWEQLQAFRTTWFSTLEYELADLRLLSLITHAWSLAQQKRSGWHLLATVNREYVDHLFMQRRFSECREVAHRTLDIYSAEGYKDEQTDRAAIRLAETFAQQGSRQGLNAAFSLLTQWLPGVSHPVYIGWILRNLAQLKALRGEMDDAISLGWQSIQYTEKVAGSYDYLHRRHDLAQILLYAGRAQQAQEVAMISNDHPFYLLVRAETCFGMKDWATAHQLVNEASVLLEHPSDVITQPEITFYRPVVERLMEQQEGADYRSILLLQ